MKAAICLLVCLAVAVTGYKSVHLPVYHNDHLQFHPKVIVYPAIHKLPATTTTTRPVVYAAPPTIDASYVLEHSPFTCNGLIDGHYADISFDCMFFHQCQVFYKDDGKQYIQQAVFPCGEGTLFNQTTKTCDYADHVSCDHLIVESIVRYQQTMPIPTSGPSKAKPIPETSFKCSPHEHKNGYYFADEETDCEVYHRCVYHNEKEVTYATEYSFMCPENLMFNQTTISSIHKLPATTTTTTTTTKRPVYAAPPTIDAAYVLEHSPFTCLGLIDGHYADISFDCMFFHQCQVFYKDDGKQYIQQAVFPCGDGTLFNQTTKTCDYADNVSCDHLIVESIVRYQQTMPIPTSGPSKAKPIPATSFKCSPHEHKNGFYFADEETDCEVYHRCVYHDEKEITYATQFSFMCPAAIHKLPATTTTKRPVVYAAPPTIDAAYVLENSPFTCHGLIDGHYADISFDCMFFHQCQVFYKDDGQKYIQQAVFPCGEGTLFNQTTKTCDYADNVSCDHLIVESIVRYQQTMPIPTSGPSKAKPIPGTSFKCSPHEHKNGFYFADEETDCEVYHRLVCLGSYIEKPIGYLFSAVLMLNINLEKEENKMILLVFETFFLINSILDFIRLIVFKIFFFIKLCLNVNNELKVEILNHVHQSETKAKQNGGDADAK
ncbi:hypothetical protein GQR58_012472 [Nymphon striatum]|nr:hypothetical protein GQR58_012472 [Nymphon striatum]